MRIPSKHFAEAAATLEHGKQIRINHTKCPAGEDTKERLYVKRDYNRILAYCHNCTGWGLIKRTSTSSWKYVSPQIKTAVGMVVAEHPPECIPYTVSEDNLSALNLYVGKMHTDFAKTGALCRYMFLTSDRQRLVYKIEDAGNSFWQIKSWGRSTTYYSGYNQTKRAIILPSLDPHPTPCKLLVITEDIASAASATAAGADATPLLGTTPADFDYLVTRIRDGGYEQVVVALDADTAGMQGAAALCERLCLAVGCAVCNITPGLTKDLKLYNTTEIGALLWT